MHSPSLTQVLLSFALTCVACLLLVVSAPIIYPGLRDILPGNVILRGILSGAGFLLGLGLILELTRLKMSVIRAEQELTRMEREFGEALTRRDTAALKDLMAGDFIGFYPLGMELTKADVLAQVTSPDSDLESLHNEEIRVRVFGDCAVATAVAVAKGRYQGQDASGRFRYTRVWLRRGGRWQAIAGQSTRNAQP